jgi:hypothetical protein
MSCSHINKHQKESCEFKSLSLLFTSPLSTGDSLIGYCHYITIKDFSKECHDSAIIVDIARRYADTVNIDQPVTIIQIYNSDKRFVAKEGISQDWQEVNKDCLVGIELDNKTKLPVKFTFYDKRGNLVHDNSYWLNSR